MREVTVRLSCAAFLQSDWRQKIPKRATRQMYTIPQTLSRGECIGGCGYETNLVADEDFDVESTVAGG